MGDRDPSMPARSDVGASNSAREPEATTAEKKRPVGMYPCGEMKADGSGMCEKTYTKLFNVKRHKKVAHPEIYEQEMAADAAEKARNGSKSSTGSAQKGKGVDRAGAGVSLAARVDPAPMSPDVNLAVQAGPGVEANYDGKLMLRHPSQVGFPAASRMVQHDNGHFAPLPNGFGRRQSQHIENPMAMSVERDETAVGPLMDIDHRLDYWAPGMSFDQFPSQAQFNAACNQDLYRGHHRSVLEKFADHSKSSLGRNEDIGMYPGPSNENQGLDFAGNVKHEPEDHDMDLLGIAQAPLPSGPSQAQHHMARNFRQSASWGLQQIAVNPGVKTLNELSQGELDHLVQMDLLKLATQNFKGTAMGCSSSQHQGVPTPVENALEEFTQQIAQLEREHMAQVHHQNFVQMISQQQMVQNSQLDMLGQSHPELWQSQQMQMPQQHMAQGSHAIMGQQPEQQILQMPQVPQYHTEHAAQLTHRLGALQPVNHWGMESIMNPCRPLMSPAQLNDAYSQHIGEPADEPMEGSDFDVSDQNSDRLYWPNAAPTPDFSLASSPFDLPEDDEKTQRNPNNNAGLN
ncbi:hypothetical protein QBC35DRAFT_474527 [Podospora australis]|uniref:Uncharacterized protein n=1 Tax=Podospora australis TaxID=1536484 RepID=A0AAN6WTV4_9PEZI|nr:hypothetical protein QBC35DRAFT_474527 [Podospora australis]